MRKLFFLLIVPFSSILFVTSCSKDDNNPLGEQNPNELVHLKMKVNGKEWISENTADNIKAEAYYTVWKAEENPEDRPYEISIDGRSTNNFPGGLSDFSIHIILEKPLTLGKYIFDDVRYIKFRLAKAGDIFKGYENGGDLKVMVNSMTQIQDTEYSTTYRIRGTFHGKLKNIEGGKDDTLTITDGEYK